MNETPPKGRKLRSVGAVLAGFLAIVVLSVAADTTMEATGIFPKFGGPPMADSLFAIALAYRFLFGVVGCWIAARLAPYAPMKHALALGALGVLVSTAGAVAMWKAGPPWYSLAVIGDLAAERVDRGEAGRVAVMAGRSVAEPVAGARHLA